jgi:hypothetical protein
MDSFMQLKPVVPAIDAISVPSALLGSWSATRWQYTSRLPPERVVDLICDRGGSVTLSLSRDSYILAWEVAGEERQCVGGRAAVNGDQLEFQDDGSTERVEFRLGLSELSIRSEGSRWIFDGDSGEGPASFVAVFVRV